ncbi:MAG TPA: hypothetical protein VFE19_02380 [Jatrophihabitantaceae bacterium]|jgi:hypothetical protein|nr:hypothetical protein [Jatrophihabitantaceae bacterium]
MVRRFVLLVGLAVVLSGTAACAESADGARRSVCGTWIGSPADGADRSPWFVDASHQAPSSPIKGYVDIARPPVALMVVNMLVSDDCAHGARVTVAGPPVVSVRTEVRTDDRRTSVALILARGAGRTTVVVTRPGRASIRVPFVIRAANSRTS